MGALQAQDVPHLLVHGDAGEIAYMLPGAGQLVKQGGFAAVLVAGQGKGEATLRRFCPLALAPAPAQALAAPLLLDGHAGSTSTLRASCRRRVRL